jgi:hypothetical protein
MPLLNGVHEQLTIRIRIAIISMLYALVGFEPGLSVLGVYTYDATEPRRQVVLSSLCY